MLKSWRVAFVLCCLAVFGAALWAAQKLVPEEFVVQPGAVRYWTFEVNGSARITGRFHTAGGTKNDIEAIVAEWSECENWINGNQAHVFYQSGKVTNGSVDVQVNGYGKHCIAFSNRMSVISSKEVAAEIGIQ